MTNFSITTTDFKDGEEIPKKHGYKFENIIPNIYFDNLPEKTKSFALIMDDPDAMAVVGKVWVHWLEYYDGADKDQDIPHSARLLERQILMKLDMEDLHHQMDVIHTSSKDMH